MTRHQVDVLVIGAGPAGSAAAIRLARGGARVALVDRQAFPRDKACGDALIPDALRALDRLSLRAEVLAHARVMDRIRVFAPNGRHVDIGGTCACVPRRVLDDLLRQEAVASGAEFHGRLQLIDARRDGAAVRGATFASAGGGRVTFEAHTTMLATGAAREPLQILGVCERDTPSAVAARMYVETDAATAAGFDHLCISYHRAICPGYGWIFPGPDRTFNIGVGWFYDSRRSGRSPNVRTLFDTFVTTFPPAIAVMARARSRGALKGALLRTGLAGAALGVSGLLVIGEAAGMTYSLSGEGIGKAMESGVLAADVVLSGTPAAAPSTMAAEYAARVRDAFGSRFRAYAIAQDWLSRPAVANFVAWRAARSASVTRQLEGMFQETADPRRLFSASGLIRALVS